MRIQRPAGREDHLGTDPGFRVLISGLINCSTTLIIADTISQFEAAQDSARKEGDGQTDSQARVLLLQLATATHGAQVVRVRLCGQIYVLRRVLVVCGRCRG